MTPTSQPPEIKTFKIKHFGYYTLCKIKKIKDFLVGLLWVLFGPGPILPRRRL